MGAHKQCKVNYWAHKTTDKWHHQQHNTHALPHDHQTVQGLTDGHVVVTGHQQQKDDLWSSKKVLCKQLGQTSLEEYGIFPKVQVWNQSRGEAYIRSINDKLARKKYSSELRVLLTVIVTTMSRLPTRVKCRRARTQQKGLSAPLDSVWGPGGQSKLHCSVVPSNVDRSWVLVLEVVYLQNEVDGAVNVL